MADVNFGPAHAIEFWYITRHGFDHKPEKHPANKKEDKKTHQQEHKHEQKHVDKKKDEHNSEHKKGEHQTKGESKKAYTTPNFGHANHLLYWWMLRHEAAAIKESHHHAELSSDHQHQHSATKQPNTNTHTKKADEKKEKATPAATAPATPAAEVPAASTNGAAKKKKKKAAGKKEPKEPSGESQTATTAAQVREFLAKNQNFTIGDSVTDLGEPLVKLPHSQALHLAKVLASTSAPLTTLHLSGSNLQPDGMKALEPFFEKSSTVVDVDLSDCSIHDAGVVSLVSALKKNIRSAVASLNLANNKVTEKAAPALAELVGNSSTILKKLVLDGNELGVNGLKALLLAATRPLDTLSLQNVKINADAGSVIGTWLAHPNTSVQHLLLHDNQLGDRGAITVVSESANSRSLKTLDLSKNNIGNKAFEELSRLLQKRAVFVETLNLSDNTMGRLNEGKLKSLLKKNHEIRQSMEAREQLRRMAQPVQGKPEQESK